MSIIKVEIKPHEAQKVILAFAENRLAALEGLATMLRSTCTDVVNSLLEAEIDLFLGAPEESDNKRNGFRERDYTLKGVGAIRVKLPTDRKRRFSSSIIPKSERVDPRLSQDIAALHLGGLSTRTLSLMAERILGIEISPKTVTNSLVSLADGAEKWLRRPIERKYWALMVDGTNFRVRRRGSVEKEPSLVVVGIDESNKRSILAIEPGNRDDVSSWRMVFRELKSRGLDISAVKLGVMDGLPGLETLFIDEFPHAQTQRCWFHALQNVLAKTPKRLFSPMHALCLKIMYAPSKEVAQKSFKEIKDAMNVDASRAISCLEKDLESLLRFFDFDKKLWHTLRTTNGVERINKEFKRRTKSMESLGEMTLQKVLAFTALRIELAWQRRAVDSYETDHLAPRLAKVAKVMLEGPEEIQ
jgi:putative transposase